MPSPCATIVFQGKGPLAVGGLSFLTCLQMKSSPPTMVPLSANQASPSQGEVAKQSFGGGVGATPEKATQSVLSAMPLF